jgi:pimeloyl-ACP methyl ester carboxylesterase
VLLVHGWAGSKDTWGPLPEALADAGFRAIAVDLPGWGGSPAERGHPHRPDSYATALAPLVRAGAVGLVAHSMGVQVALFLARAGAGIERLVLLSPPVLPVEGVAFPPRTLVDLVTLPVVGVPAARAAMALMKRRPPAPETRYRRTVGDPAVLRSQAARDLVERSERLFASTPTRVMARSLRATALADMRPVAAAVAQPTLVVAGGRDRVVHPREAEILARLLPDARLLRIPGSGHLPHLEAAGVVLPEIVAHLTAHLARAGGPDASEDPAE